MKTLRPVLRAISLGLLVLSPPLDSPLLAQDKPAAQASESSSLAHELLGTWVLVSQTGRTGDTPWAKGRLKFLTDHYWTTTQADPATGLTIYHHGGTYTLDGDQYAETIEYADANTQENLKQTFHFTVKVEGDTLTQTALDNPWSQVWRRATGDDLLVPGQSAGPYHLGTKEEQMIKQLGEPSFKDAVGDTAWDDYYTKPQNGGFAEEVNVLLRHEDREHPGQWFVRQVTVTSPTFHTASGLSVQSSPAAIWREFSDLRYVTTEEGGDGTWLELYSSTSKGVGFLFERTEHPKGDDPWGKCRGIVVHRVGESARFDRIGKTRR